MTTSPLLPKTPKLEQKKIRPLFPAPPPLRHQVFTRTNSKKTSEPEIVSRKYLADFLDAAGNLFPADTAKEEKSAIQSKSGIRLSPTILNPSIPSTAASCTSQKSSNLRPSSKLNRGVSPHRGQIYFLYSSFELPCMTVRPLPHYRIGTRAGKIVMPPFSVLHGR